MPPNTVSLKSVLFFSCYPSLYQTSRSWSVCRNKWRVYTVTPLFWSAGPYSKTGIFRVIFKCNLCILASYIWCANHRLLGCVRVVSDLISLCGSRSRAVRRSVVLGFRVSNGGRQSDETCYSAHEPIPWNLKWIQNIVLCCIHMVVVSDLGQMCNCLGFKYVEYVCPRLILPGAIASTNPEGRVCNFCKKMCF